MEKINTNVFYIKNKYEDRFLSEDYNSLLNIINKKTNIHKDIIDTLYLFDILDKIISIEIEKNENSTKVTVQDNFFIFDNFESTQAYIFSLLSLNKDYEIHFGTHFNYFKNNKNNLYLYLINQQKDIKIEMVYSYQEKNLIPYDINILNNIEKELLHKSISYQYTFINLNFIFITLTNHQLAGKQFIWSLKNLLNYSSYDSLIDRIEDFNNELDNLIFSFNEDNKLFFQRALTEIQIKNF